VIDLSPEAEAAIERLRQIDRERPEVDRPRVERAVRNHLSQARLGELPLRWARDAEEGYLLTARSRASQAWRSITDPDERSAGFDDPDLSWLFRGPIWPHAWTRAEMAARDTAEQVALAKCGEVRWPAPWSAAGAAVREAAWLAARDHARTRRARAFAEHHVRIWHPLREAFEAGLWLFWVLEREVIAVPRPAVRTLDGRLHCEGGPAVAWPDGARYYFWRGIRVPERVVVALTASEIIAEENLEVQRVMLERFGYDRLMLETGAAPVHGDEFGTLYRIPIPHGRPIALLHVTNSTPEPDGTRKRYFLRVPPDARTAREAVAWTFGLRAEEYRPVEET
jgi:hypothetical protein